MNKANLKTLPLLLPPVFLVLVGLVLTLNKTHKIRTFPASYQITKIQALTVTPTKQTQYNSSWQRATRVTVEFTRHDFGFLNYLRTNQIDSGVGYLADEKGNGYKRFLCAGKFVAMDQYLEHNVGHKARVIYQFPLDQVHQNADVVRLKATIRVDDVYDFPISVIVRQ